MTSWVATSFGALDLTDNELSSAGGEILVVPTVPSEPVFLRGDGAGIWRRLVDGPVDDASLSDAERDIVHDMRDMRIASSDIEDPNRIRLLGEPWLVSPFHELVYALIANVAAQHQIDVMFIKGPTLHAQGLRSREHSGDVDCWIAPGNERRLAQAMQEWGWSPRYSPFTGTPVPHALTLSATTNWQCAIDVHTWFPGIGLEPRVAFTTIKKMCELRIFSGSALDVPAAPAHAIIAALHEVRPLNGPTAPHQNSSAAQIIRDGGPATVEMARKLQACFALTQAISVAFPGAECEPDIAEPPADWKWRAIASGPHRQREALRLVPVLDRPRVIFRLLWPSSKWIRVAPEDADASTWSLSIRRIRRILTSARTLLRRSS